MIRHSIKISATLIMRGQPEGACADESLLQAMKGIAITTNGSTFFKINCSDIDAMAATLKNNSF